VTVRRLQGGDLEALFALRQLSFLDRSDFDDPAVRARHEVRLPFSYGHFDQETDQEKLTSAAICFPFEMYHAGKRVRVGGLAGVLSAPETRRRGFVRDLLHAILSDLKDNGVGWALEYPFDPRFYARYSFATVPTGSEVTVPAERLFRGPSPDAERFRGDPERVLEPIYSAWAQHYALTLCRDNPARPTWTRILGDNVCYLLEDAYVVFELEHTSSGQTLTVHDYAFRTPAGRERVFRFIGSFYGQADRISLHLPSDEPLALDVQNYHTNELPILQARIVDLGAALNPLESTVESTFTVRIRDDFCSWNDGVFKLTLTPSGTRVSHSDAQPEATLSVATLTQLVVGALSPTAALRAGLAEGHLQPIQTLAALGQGRIPFMPSSDYF
jgi:predicted acetyltransferase